MDVQAYLSRIGFTGKVEDTLACLIDLHRLHVTTIPFEAINAYLGMKISLDMHDIFQKVIHNNRGGYCYELNYLFYTLLIEVGFNAKMIAANVFHNNEFGPDYDHMAIIVDIEKRWLVDVGFGNLFVKPLQLVPTVMQIDERKTFRFLHLEKDQYILESYVSVEDKFEAAYSFNLTACVIEDFVEQNTYKQSSENSHFVQQFICTLATKNGRKTINRKVYKVTEYEDELEIKIEDEKHLHSLLAKEFGIELQEKFFTHKS